MTNEQANDFINKILSNTLIEGRVVKPEELAISKRLGITYQEVENKFLIAYTIEKSLKESIINKKFNYEINISQLDNNITVLNFEVEEADYSQKFYFENDKLISSITYHIKNWKIIETKYFKVWVSYPALFNKYSADALDSFVEEMLNTLNFTQEEKQKLTNEKIYYVFCKDEDEIQKLTGFKTIGIYNLACDYIVSTYNCHFHEICHLLMNYKLRQVPLYTHPFMQEGFAVGFGGRGGRNPEVIRKVGEYLLNSGIMELPALYTKDGFNSEDASMTYPVVGFYNFNLFKEIGLESYLQLYKKYSSGEANINNVKIMKEDIPDFKKYKENSTITFPGKSIETSLNNYEYNVYDKNDNYIFSMKDTMLISTGDCEPGYQSKKFDEMVKTRKYNGEKYLILVSESEILIYNLFTNILIANFVSSFEIPAVSVPKRNNGYYDFIISKKYFDEDLTKAKVRN